MSDKSKIAWTDATWITITGCTPVSAACANCYARGMHKRLQAMGQWKYQEAFSKVVCHDNEELLSQPSRWKRPRKIFVNSMSDTFHRDVPFDFIDKIYDAMFAAPQHIFQVLTKRPGRMNEYIRRAPFDLPANIWHGVTVEGFKNENRIVRMLRNRCLVNTFVSFEPLLDSVKGVSLRDVDLAIIGGESGPGARPMEMSWVYEIIEEARRVGCAVFVKQMGAVWAKENNSKTSKGEDPSEWPEDLRIQEMPNG